MRYFGLMMLLFTVALIGGCGDGKINSVGRITLKGAPFIVPEDDFVRVLFVPFSENGEQPKTCYIAQFDNAKGTFKAIGPDLNGVPPGKYRIAVAHEKGKRDVFRGAFDLPRTPFVFEINSSAKEIVLDLVPPKFNPQEDGEDSGG